MNLRVLGAVIDQLGTHPRDFLAGWMEGRHRYQSAGGDKSIVAGSVLPRGSTGYAASQAAVAFYEALDAR